MSFIFLLPSTSAATVSLSRTANDFGQNFSSATLPTLPCQFSGSIVVSHPISLTPSDAFFIKSNSQLHAYSMLTDKLNRQRCGVQVNGNRYKLILRSFGDESDVDRVANIVSLLPGRRARHFSNSNNLTSTALTPVTHQLCCDTPTLRSLAHFLSQMINSAPTTDFFLGPYSSTLTRGAALHANAASKVMIAQGAASSPIYADNEFVFGTLPPASSFLDKALELLAGQGAKSVKGVMEAASFTRGVCGGIASFSAKYGLDDRGNVEVPLNPTIAELLPLAKNLTVNTPDIIVGCMYVTGCTAWTKAMRAGVCASERANERGPKEVAWRTHYLCN